MCLSLISGEVQGWYRLPELSGCIVVYGGRISGVAGADFSRLVDSERTTPLRRL